MWGAYMQLAPHVAESVRVPRANNSMQMTPESQNTYIVTFPANRRTSNFFLALGVLAFQVILCEVQNATSMIHHLSLQIPGYVYLFCNPSMT